MKSYDFVDRHLGELRKKMETIIPEYKENTYGIRKVLRELSCK